ncbi:MAG TPA: glycosyltransferase [Thermoplasmata archaeon]|nr:glycosyltransferase [Thermoplasmata archaeon]
MLARLGIKSWRDVVIFVSVVGYALAIFILMIGAIARDFGLISFAGPTGRPIILDLTFVTIGLSLIIFGIAILWLAFALVSLVFRPSYLDPNSIEIHSPLVSVLIPAHNEESVVHDLVTDLLAQDYPNLEVLVIAHNCTDRTVQTLRPITDPRLKVLELHTSDSGKALALNFGLERSSGEIVAQFDADNRVRDLQLVRRAVAYFLTDTGVDVIQSQIETKNESATLLTRLQALEYRVFSHLFWGGRNVVGLPCPVAGTGVFFRRVVLDRVGAWENELVEDYDLYCKLVIDRARIEYKPDLIVWDEKPPSWRLLMRQRSRWQRGHLEVLAKRWRTWMGVTDMMYLAAPIANAAWYASTIITLLYHVLPWSFTYWYPPAVLWLSLWVAAYVTMGFILIRTGHARDIRYLPAFYVYSFHWLIAFLLAFRVKGWSSSKTPHGAAA